VGRNEVENKTLKELRSKSDYYFELPDTVGPITILQGVKTRKAIQTVAQLTAFYSDAKTEKKVKVNYGKNALNKSITVIIPNREEVDALRAGQKISTQQWLSK
jgi:predicted ribosome quality control (RQC) complex YloA/Tae2 family protein